MADTTQTAAFPLASEGYTGGVNGGGGSGSGIDDDGGASGTSTSNVGISQGALIAIILVVVLVALIGVASSVLFYVAKKREWRVRETIRRSARRVVTALTPRRAEFPRSVRDGPGGGGGGRTSRNGRMRLDDVPPTPRLPRDLEKGLGGKDSSSSRAASSSTTRTLKSKLTGRS